MDRYYPPTYSTSRVYSSLSLSTPSSASLFFLSSSISLYVLQLSKIKAAMMRSPPAIAAADNGTPVRSQSTIATRKIVRRAATEDRTGEVREMRTRNEPEKAGICCQQVYGRRAFKDNSLALARTEIAIIQAASPFGSSNFSTPVT
jgi:hypothetical protein